MRLLVLPGALAMAGSLAACQGCRGSSVGAPVAGPPTVRLILVSTVAGALEPCGCSKNQLGGFDHWSALITEKKASAPHTLVAASGPMFFLDPLPRGEKGKQDEWKAEALASALSRVGFVGWAPGSNDWAAGDEKLRELSKRSGGVAIAANVSASVPTAPFVVRDAGGTKVAFVGVSTPSKAGVLPGGVEVKPPGEALALALAAARAEGAKVFVGLFAMPRGEALRLVEGAPELHVAAIGKPYDQGEQNDKPSPATMLGRTLVVETANHLQTTAIVDLHVRDEAAGSRKPSEPLTFLDAAGIGRASERAALDKRIDELAAKVRSWEQSPTIQKADLEGRRADLERLRVEKRAFETPAPPAKGSFFRYTMEEIRTELGRDETTYAAMLSYYRRVNEHNRQAFADRKPPPPGPDGNKFTGGEACAVCHPAARSVWKKTPHARAYATLVDGHKEFNLDCVGCHVTGYERPGGSTVTVNDTLQAVQCEECHGPGERHRNAPSDKALIIGRPKPESCVSGCHHTPHVEGFDPVARMHAILGQGHGKVEEWPPLKPR